MNNHSRQNKFQNLKIGGGETSVDTLQGKRKVK